MMKSRNYNENEVMRQLNQKNDLFVVDRMVTDPNTKQSFREKHIYELAPPDSKGDVGIRSRGKISFLTKYCGFFYTLVSAKEMIKAKYSK